MNHVLIAIGGIGEGCLVHLKQLEQMSAFSFVGGSIALTEKLLISSSLSERHYSDPLNEVAVNTAAGSPEFMGLNADIQSAIDRVRRGDNGLSISVWFTPDIAKALPERVAEIDMGTGAQGVVSKAAVALEAKRIAGDIRKAIRRARNSDEHTLISVVGGIGTGGTGTGAYLDVLRICRSVVSGLKNTTLAAVPVIGARGCEVLQDSQQEADSLYARSGAAYMAVCAGQSSPVATQHSVGQGVFAEASQIADIVWFIEGDAGDPGAPSREPMYGLARTAAGIIEALAAEEGALGGLIPSWRDKAGQAAPWACAGSAGASSIRVDGLHLLKQASLHLTKLFYEGLTTRPEGTTNAGESRASSLLADFLPATYVRMSAAEEPVPIEPPVGDSVRTMSGLAELMSDLDGDTGPFPSSPRHDIKHLPDEIHVSAAANLWTVSNDAVVRNCDAMVEAYLGDPRVRPRRDDEWTVAGWIAVCAEGVVTDFEALVDNEMRERTIDQSTGEAYTVKQAPTALIDAYDLLSTMHSRIERFRRLAMRQLEDASPALEQRAAARAEARSELLSGGRSGAKQRDFLQVAQSDLDMRVWHALLSAHIEIAEGWLRCLQRWLDEVGEGPSGWLTYLGGLRDDTRKRADDLLAGRRRLACAANHTFVPHVGSEAEQALLEEMVVEAGVLDELRDACRFTWMLDDTGLPRLLLDGLSPAPSRERESVVRRLRALGSSRAYERKVTNHVSADTLHYGERALTSALRRLSVWDGLAFEYVHVEVPRAERDRQVPDAVSWAHQKADELLRGSKAEMALNGEGVSDVFRERVAWGPITTTGLHPMSAGIAEAFAERLNGGTFSVVDVPGNSTVLRAFECLLRVPHDASSLYEPMMQALARVPDETLGLYAPEPSVRRAERLRRTLSRHGIKRPPWSFGPVAVSLAADVDGTDGSLRRAALGLLTGSFDTIPGKGSDGDSVGVVVAGRVLADFGEASPTAIIEALRDPMHARAVAEVDGRLDAFIAQYRSGDGGLDPAFAVELEAAALRLWSEKLDVEDRDERDVYLLLTAEALSLADTYGGDHDATIRSASEHRRAVPAEQQGEGAKAAAAVPSGRRTVPPAGSQSADVLVKSVSWAGNGEAHRSA